MLHFAKHGLDSLIGTLSAVFLASVLGLLQFPSQAEAQTFPCTSCVGTSTCINAPPSCTGVGGTYGSGCTGWGAWCTSSPKCAGSTPPPVVTCHTAAGC
jgi:hypothetical protein